MQNDHYLDGKLKDFYSILQVDRDADHNTISTAYKSLAKRYHPDLGGSKEMMQTINEAYNELKDETRKKAYDTLYDNLRKYMLEKLEEKDKIKNSSNYIFLVTVFSKQYKVPQTCPCCLEKATKNFDIKYTLSKHIKTDNKEIKVTFPICNDCINHDKEINKKGYIITISGSIISAVVSLIFKVMMDFVWLELIAIGTIISIVSVIILKSIIRISNLDEKHVCRCEPVRISSYDKVGTTFEFCNWLYAEQFAKSNKSELIKKEKTNVLKDSINYDGKLLYKVMIYCLILMIIINTFISIISIIIE